MEQPLITRGFFFASGEKKLYKTKNSKKVFLVCESAVAIDVVTSLCDWACFTGSSFYVPRGGMTWCLALANEVWLLAAHCYS